MTVNTTPNGLPWPDDNEAWKLTGQRIKGLAQKLDPSPAGNLSMVSGAWTTLSTFATGWTGLGVSVPKYRVRNGLVEFTGVCFYSGGIPAATGSIFSVPVGIAPTAADSSPIGGMSWLTAATTRGTPTTLTVAIINVRATGAAVYQLAGAASVGSGTPDCISLNGLHWRINGF